MGKQICQMTADIAIAREYKKNKKKKEKKKKRNYCMLLDVPI